jgi:hypothetical protein
LIAVLYRGILAIEEADILFVKVNIDKPSLGLSIVQLLLNSGVLGIQI